MSSGRYDVVVIGSGIGGLTCGAFLARAGMRVAVFEKHAKIGGYAHSFTRGPFRFESGIHSIPLGDNSLIRHMLTLLGVSDLVSVTPLPSMYSFSSPGFSFRVPMQYAEIRDALLENFPVERNNILRLLADIERFYTALAKPLLDFELNFREENTDFVSAYHNRSVADHIALFVDDPHLRQVFHAMWPYAGANAAYAPTVFFMVMFAIHLFEGSHHVKGGAGMLAEALRQAIVNYGGEVRARSAVESVDIVNGKVGAVTLKSDERITADVVVSNISPFTLHSTMIADASRKALWMRRLSKLRPSVSCVAVYCSVTPEIAKLLPDDITFSFGNMDEHYRYGERLFTDPAALDHLVLLTTRAAEAPSTLTLLQFVRSSCSRTWRTDKMAAAEAMIAKAEQLYPGLRSLIRHVEVGSPDTFERFTGNTAGALYGFENSKNIYAEAKMPIKTYLPHLYQTGHWGKPGGGVWNVMVNGYTAAKIIERDLNLLAARKKRAVSGPRKHASMRLRCIYPRFNKFLTGHDVLRPLVEKHLIGEYTMPPSLALPVLAALTPAEWEVRLTDDNIGQPVDFDEKVDAVVISCFTPQASRAYELSDEFRRRGTKVLLGGMHPTCRPQEAMEHADAVCIGEGEEVWPQMLADLRAGRLRTRYEPSGFFPLERFPLPRREIFDRDNYQWSAHLILVSRGCPVHCAACPVPVKEGTMLRFRPVDKVIDDIISMPYREFYITDDTVMLPGKRSMKYLLSLMERTAGMNMSIFLASTMMMVSEPSFYRKLAAGGATSMYTVFGYDRVSRRLLSPECSRDEWQQAIDLVRMNEDAGIRFFASIGVGFDDQDESVFERIERFLSDARITLAEFYICTPFPGTPFGLQCEKENRILHRDYNRWNTGNIVFRPKNMRPERLLEGYYRLWQEFYRYGEPAATLRSFREINRSLVKEHTPRTAQAIADTPGPRV
ncbi:MAG: FAD-dependent oxidoreductase [Chitinispirillaceae bacterium]|nr:FAD-dependent oxidoreductase [Chitinispirillaceae bacterium]